MALRRRRSRTALAKKKQGSIGRTAQTIRGRVQPSRRRRAELAARQRKQRLTFNKRIKDAIDKGPQIPHMGPKGPSYAKRGGGFDPSKRPKATVIKAKPTISTNDPFGRKRKSTAAANTARKRLTRRQRLLMRRSAAQRRMNDNRMTRDGISLRRKSGKVSVPKAVKNIGLKSKLKKAVGRPKVPKAPIRKMPIGPSRVPPKQYGPASKARPGPPKAPIRKMPIGPRRRSRFGRRR